MTMPTREPTEPLGTADTEPPPAPDVERICRNPDTGWEIDRDDPTVLHATLIRTSPGRIDRVLVKVVTKSGPTGPVERIQRFRAERVADKVEDEQRSEPPRRHCIPKLCCECEHWRRAFDECTAPDRPAVGSPPGYLRGLADDGGNDSCDLFERRER